jgi:hypothetical protein
VGPQVYFKKEAAMFPFFVSSFLQDRREVYAERSEMEMRQTPSVP